jgi:hypothetical protein
MTKGGRSKDYMLEFISESDEEIDEVEELKA